MITNGDIPKIYSEHTSNVIKNKIYVFGGASFFYKLNVDKKEWKKINSVGIAP